MAVDRYEFNCETSDRPYRLYFMASRVRGGDTMTVLMVIGE